MKKPSYKKSVENMCKQCVYDTKGEGTWREQVKNCCGYTCPLYNLRPMPQGSKHKWQMNVKNDSLSLSKQIQLEENDL